MNRLGWHHQMGHAITHILDRLDHFEDEHPAAITITMEDAAGQQYTSRWEQRPGDFLEQLGQELDAVRRGD